MISYSDQILGQRIGSQNHRDGPQEIKNEKKLFLKGAIGGNRSAIRGNKIKNQKAI